MNDASEPEQARQALWRARREAEEMAARMRVIAEAAARIVGAASVEELGDVLRAACGKVVPFDAFAFALYEPDRHAFRFLAMIDAGIAEPARTVPAAGTPAERALRERRSLLTHSAQEPAARGARLVGTGRPSESAIRTPVLTADRALGLVSVHSYRANHYTTRDVELLEALAALAATGLVNIELAAAREASDRALRESEERYRRLVELSPDAIAVHCEGELVFINRSGARLLGAERPEDLLGRSIFDFVHPDSRPLVEERVRRMVAGGDAGGVVEEAFIRLDGSIAYGEVAAAPLLYRGRPAVQVVVRDLTDRRKAEDALRRSEEQLAQAQRLEAIGRLAGGIAHDFNNLLTAIKGHARLVALDLPGSDPRAEALDEIAQAATRAAELTRQLLAFGRRQVLSPRVLSLNQVVRGVEKLLARLIREDIELVIRLEPELAHIEADRGQIEQVLMNLGVNARDAMPGGGRLTIETRNAVLAEDQTPEGLGPGEYVLLVVTDTGIGMSDEVRQQIFDPFFTTKGLGQGTGLGLATVYGIVKQSGGSIAVESTPGAGSTFRVYLPAVARPLDAEEPSSYGAELVRGGETVLLVEDEPSVRRLVRRVLERSGYRVIEARDGSHALRIVREQRDPIQLVLTDIVMPGMSGPELVRQLRPVLPAAAILFMSGYAEGGLGSETFPGAAFLPKPFDPETLTARVREVLDARAADGDAGARG